MYLRFLCFQIIKFYDFLAMFSGKLYAFSVCGVWKSTEFGKLFARPWKVWNLAILALKSTEFEKLQVSRFQPFYFYLWHTVYFSTLNFFLESWKSLKTSQIGQETPGISSWYDYRNLTLQYHCQHLLVIIWSLCTSAV